MPLFGRRSREASTAASAPLLGDQPCSEKGCTETTGLVCTYVDRRGRECETAWCPAHRAEVDGRTYCRRHAGVTRALERSETPSPPDVSSRAASLAAWVSADLEPRVVALLEKVSEPGEQLRIQAPRLVFVGRQRIRAWESAWKLARHTGLGHWVSIQVPEEHDDHIELIVDGNRVHEGVPPWIAARQDGRALEPAEDARVREEYYAELVETIQTQLSRGAQRH